MFESFQITKGQQSVSYIVSGNCHFFSLHVEACCNIPTEELIRKICIPLKRVCTSMYDIALISKILRALRSDGEVIIFTYIKLLLADTAIYF